MGEKSTRFWFYRQKDVQKVEHYYSNWKLVLISSLWPTLATTNPLFVWQLSESQTQCDQMEHQLLKVNDKRGRQSSRLSLNSPIVEEVPDIANDDPTLGSLQLLLAARLGSDLDNNVINIAKQLHELKADKQRLEDELRNRSHELKELLQKYERRKIRHKEMLVRLRYDHH